MSVSPWDNVSNTFILFEWPCPLVSISKLYFYHIFVSGQYRFCSLTKVYKIWHVGVSPWDNMLCIFMISVWPRPLTYMWAAGASSVSFTQCLSHLLLQKAYVWLLWRYMKPLFENVVYLIKKRIYYLIDFFLKKSKPNNILQNTNVKEIVVRISHHQLF